MRWKGRRGSENLEDRRSARGPAVAGGSLLGLILIVVVILLGGDPRPLLQNIEVNPPPQQAGQAAIDPAQDEQAQFVSVVLADTEDVWHESFRELGSEYREPTLVLLRG
jgi:predicted metalloprotease